MSFSYFKSHHQGKTINWNQLTDFKPYKIGTVLGSPLADKLKPLGVKVESTPTLEAGIKKLFNRRIDIMEGAGVANQYMVKQLYPESLDDYAETEKALMRMDIGFIHWKDNAEATAKLKKFLIGWERIKRNGVFLNIQQKHWGKNVPDSVLKAFGY
jgi:polar amino acid transport system substrate-binding protein